MGRAWEGYRRFRRIPSEGETTQQFKASLPVRTVTERRDFLRVRFYPGNERYPRLFIGRRGCCRRSRDGTLLANFVSVRRCH
jgi:hypothetical protein